MYDINLDFSIIFKSHVGLKVILDTFFPILYLKILWDNVFW